MYPSILRDEFCRSPYGERGLKFVILRCKRFVYGRSPYGERGLKWLGSVTDTILDRRSPYGERGLKCRIREAWRILARVALLTESVD